MFEKLNEWCRLLKIERVASEEAIKEKKTKNQIKKIYLRLRELELVLEILAQTVLS